MDYRKLAFSQKFVGAVCLTWGFSWRRDMATKMEVLRGTCFNLCVSFTELQISPDDQPSQGHKQP